jgi:hypothetical protein
MNPDDIFFKIVLPAIFGGLGGVFFNFILSPAKELRYALTQLYSDVMYHLPALHCQQGVEKYQEEARRDIRRSASNLFAAYIRVYFYDQLAVLNCVPERSLIMHRDKDGNGDGIYHLAIGISNRVGIYLSTEQGNPESEMELQNHIQKLCLLLSQSLESMWTKYGRKRGEIMPYSPVQRVGQRAL